VWLTDIAFVGTVTSTTNKTQKQKLDRVPGRENPPNPSGASEGDLFTHSRKFTPRGVRTPDLWDAGVLQPVGLACFGNKTQKKGVNFCSHSAAEFSKRCFVSDLLWTVWSKMQSCNDLPRKFPYLP